MQITEKSVNKLAVKNVRVFTVQDEILGIPAPIFMGGLFICLIILIGTHWVLSFLMAIFYFPAMYSIHKDNPKGLAVWLRFLRQNKWYWVSGIRKKALNVLFY